MSAAAIKKARIAAQIAHSEAQNLPNSSEKIQQLLSQAESKRKLLEKKCEEYDQLCKRFAKVKNRKDSLETIHNNLMSQLDEVDAQYDKSKQEAEKNFLRQQNKNNEMNQLIQNLEKQTEKEKRMIDDLQKESNLSDELQTKCLEIRQTIDQLANEKEEDEKEYDKLLNAMDIDSKTEKTLERYLTRLVDDVFKNQRRLEDMDIGTSRGRASFRQAEKILREQKRRHRSLSAQLAELPGFNQSTKYAKATDQMEKLKNLERDWYEMQVKMRVMEQKVMEENEKANERLKEILRKQKFENEKMKINQQRELATNFDILQNQTPMYAAYTSRTDLSTNLKKKLGLRNVVNASIDGKASKSSESSIEATIESLKELAFADGGDDTEELAQMIKNKKNILKSSENEAYQQMCTELKLMKTMVSGEKQETQELDSQIKWLNDGLQTKKSDVRFYDNKFNEFMEMAKKEDEEHMNARLKAERAMKTLKMTAQKDVEELSYKHLMEEDARNNLLNQLKDSNFEFNQLDAQWKLLNGLKKTTDFNMAEKLGLELKTWQNRVSEMEQNIEKLQMMEKSAMSTNSQFRNDLALLKPYEEEYQEFESLTEINKRLNDDLTEFEDQTEVENVLRRGDVRFV